MSPLMWLFVIGFAVAFVVAVKDSGHRRHKQRSRGWNGRR